MSLLLTLNRFLTLFLCVSIDDFEQVKAGWKMMFGLLQGFVKRFGHKLFLTMGFLEAGVVVNFEYLILVWMSAPPGGQMCALS